MEVFTVCTRSVLVGPTPIPHALHKQEECANEALNRLDYTAQMLSINIGWRVEWGCVWATGGV